MISNLIHAMEGAIEHLLQRPDKSVWVFHHNDADGLCSGAILDCALTRKGFKVQRFCLEKPYPAVLKKIYEQKGRILIFADFAGRIAPMLSELNGGRNLTLILDHHVAEASTDPAVYNLDPDLFGLKGDRDISASTTCYLFARTMDPANLDLAHIATLGAVGDGFFVNGQLASQNKEAALEAEQQGSITIVKHETGEHYLFSTPEGQISCIKLGEDLDIFGGVGYFQRGPDMGVRVCFEGVTPDSALMLEKLHAIRAKAFNNEISRLQSEGLNKTSHIQWFHVEQRFMPMGVKMIGLFCEYIKEMSFIDPYKYIAGFQIIPDEIPDFGAISFKDVKISMRVSPILGQEIMAGKRMGLNALLPQATNRLGGFSDACHSLTAATTVAIGKEQELIEEMEKILKGGLDG